MHRNRTWILDPLELRTQRNRILPIEGGDGSTLSLDFTTGVLDPRLTLTRSTTGTYINSSGYVTSAAINAPRFDHDPTSIGTPRGLLIEGSAATLNSYSEDFSNAYWTKVGSSVSATSVAGPDNVSTATRRIVESATTAQHGLRRGISTTAGQTYTVSVFVKPGSYDSFGFELYWSASYNAKAEVTSISGNTQTVTSASGVNATITRTVMSASGWYRYAMTFTHPSAVGAAAPDFNVFVKQTAAYTGNGTNYMDVYGFMLETGSGASSYIPTGASTGTRNQDQVQMTDLASLGFNTSAGTMTINGTYVKDANSAAFPRSIRFMGASVQSMAMITSGKTLFGNTPNTSGGSYFEASRTLASAGAFKFGWTLTTAVNPALASATVSLNGSSTSITPLGQGAIVNPTSLQFLYGAGAATDYPSMNISSLKYWPYATTAADLNVRTSL